MPAKKFLLVALLVSWCPFLFAEQDVETITVTATRIPQPLHAIGASVAVIDLDDWRGADFTVADVLRSVPGIAVSPSGGIGQLTALRMRGGESNHTLLLLDGMELSNPATGQVDFAHLTTAGIERIEILRGAQSALWGSNAVSGVINLVTRTAGDARVRLSAGADQEQRVSVNATHHAERGSIATSFQHFQTEGDNVAGQGNERDGYRNTTAQTRLRWTPAPDTAIGLMMRKTSATTEYDRFDFSAGRLVDAPLRSRHQRTVLVADLATRTDAIEQQWNVRYFQTEDDQPNNVATSQRLQGSGLLWQTIDACLFGRPCTLGGGLEWTRERYSRVGYAVQDFENSSLLAIWKWQPDPDLFLDLSLRREDNQRFTKANVWRAALAWRLPRHPARLWLSSGIGITNPTMTELFGFFPGIGFAGNPALKPERARTTEAGFEYTPGGACCRIGLSVFHQHLVNEINGYFDPDGFAGPQLPTAVNREGRSRRLGAELELEISPHPNWRFSGNYAYVRATEGEAETVELRRPRHQYQFALHYDALDWRMRLDASTLRGVRDIGNVTLENYWLLNLTSQWSLTPMLELELRARNLLDESYEEVAGYRSPDLHVQVGVNLRFD